MRNIKKNEVLEIKKIVTEIKKYIGLDWQYFRHCTKKRSMELKI